MFHRSVGTPDEIATVVKLHGIYHEMKKVVSGAKYLLDHKVNILILYKDCGLCLT